MSMILATSEIDYSYPGGGQALNRISVGFAKGRRTAVLGRNGSGKSTLFSLLNGIQKPQRGKVLFQGEQLRYSRRELKNLRSKIGVVFQEPDSQLFSASIREDISFGPMNLGLDKSEVVHRVDAAMAAVGLTTLAGRPVHALSHGEKKRACIAGVLAMQPEVLILDEPTAGLDPAMTRELTVLLDQLHQKGLTLILATHDVDFAYAWADDICILDRGASVFQGSVDEFSTISSKLPSLGLECPWVMDMYRQLTNSDILQKSNAPPRTKADLLEFFKSGRVDLKEPS